MNESIGIKTLQISIITTLHQVDSLLLQTHNPRNSAKMRTCILTFIGATIATMAASATAETTCHKFKEIMLSFKPGATLEDV